jgi:hypothetical protein
VKKLVIVAAALSLLLGVLPASGNDKLAAGPGPGYIATDNVEWLGNIPLNTDSAGGRLLGNYFYISDDRGLTIYDVSTPASPKLTGFAALPQGPYFVEEDLDTNGSIALIGTYGDLSPASSGPLNRLVVIDVRDKAKPAVIGELEGVDSHTVSCVLNCSYAYNSDGKIIDLRDPAHPKLVGNWLAGSGAKNTHDVTEVAPGLVMTSTNPMLFLDARTTPEKPTILGRVSPGDGRLMHGNLWPQNATDKFLLAGGETSGDCDKSTAGAFMTFTHSTDPVTGAKTFTMADQFRLETGLPTEGNSPYDQFCAHWFDPHPTYKDGGLVAMGWYEHGTRFLDVNHDTGKITEKGWFYPVGGSTSAAYWVTPDILYSVDYQRGIDILRFNNTPATGTVEAPASPGYVAPIVTPRPARVHRALRSNEYICPLGA